MPREPRTFFWVNAFGFRRRMQFVVRQSVMRLVAEWFFVVVSLVEFCADKK
jgi:hypothetical protein